MLYGLNTPGKPTPVACAGETLYLLPDKAIWWPREEALLLADLHLGKATHFRRSGIAVPARSDSRDRERLLAMIDHFQPRTIYFLGDLFHSAYNAEWDALAEQIAGYPQVSFTLITGNHDILRPADYRQAGLLLHAGALVVGPFALTHEPEIPVPEGHYQLCGHIHPGYRLRGKGRQSAWLPCFILGTQRGILPAFGGFTGKMPVDPHPGDRIYVTLPGEVLAVFS